MKLIYLFRAWALSLALLSFAEAQMTSEQVEDILREGKFSRLSAEERSEAIALLKKQAGAYSASPDMLQLYLFLLGDRETNDQVIARFRKEAVQSTGPEMAASELGRSPYLETIPAIADLLWVEESEGSANDTITGNPSVYVAWAIQGILSRSPEVPPEVVVWARSFGDRGMFNWAPVFRDWWKKNERAFRERRYKDVTPGMPVEPFLPPSVEAPPIPPLTAPTSESTPQSDDQISKKTPQPAVAIKATDTTFDWLAGITLGCVAIVVSLLLLGKRRNR